MNVKEIYKKHKGIIIGGTLVVGTIAAAIVLKKMSKTQTVDLTGLSAIYWKPDGKFFTLEEAKDVLDKNVASSAMYAIFRHGTDPAKYKIIAMDDNLL